MTTLIVVFLSLFLTFFPHILIWQKKQNQLSIQERWKGVFTDPQSSWSIEKQQKQQISSKWFFLRGNNNICYTIKVKQLRERIFCLSNRCLQRNQDKNTLPTDNMDTLAPIILNQQQEQQYKSQISALEQKLKLAKEELEKQTQKTQNILDTLHQYQYLYNDLSEKKQELEKRCEVSNADAIKIGSLNAMIKVAEEQLRQKDNINYQLASQLEEVNEKLKQKENLNSQLASQLEEVDQKMRQLENNYVQLDFQMKNVQQELQTTKDTNNSLLKQIETTEKKLEENKSNINKWYATFSTELFQKSFLNILPNNIKMNLNILLKTENITDMLKSANLTIDMFDITDPFNQNNDQIPSGYLSLKLNKQYSNYNNKRATLSITQYWKTLYHSTSINNSKQIIENNFKAGKNNLYGGKKCRLTNTIITPGPNANIYFSSSIKEAEPYAFNKSQFQGNQYKVVFQCKVNLYGYKSPLEKPNYFTVENNIHILPEFMLVAP